MVGQCVMFSAANWGGACTHMNGWMRDYYVTSVRRSLILDEKMDVEHYISYKTHNSMS